MSEPPAERSRGALFLLAAVIAAAGLWFVVGSDESDEPVVRGASAPGFVLPLLGTPEETLDLASLAGRVVLVNFWATWCEPCEREMPAMERLYQRLPRDRFELVAVAIGDDEAKVAEFQKRYSLTFPIVLDPDKKVAEAYQTMGVPESLLIDAGGRIIERYVGPREWDATEYVERIEALFGAGAGGAVPVAGQSEAGPVRVD
jgi:thiol-disulfide isomerase/thioredoxin